MPFLYWISKSYSSIAICKRFKVLHFMPDQLEVQGIDTNAFEDFVARTSKVGGPFGESLLLPIVSEELPHGRGSDD